MFDSCRLIVLSALLLAAACSPRSSETADRPRAAVEPPPCPAEELSCGKQTPVRSDGVTPFKNEEFGLSVVFPEGDPVCLARSGDSPRGFFVRYGDGLACEERPVRSSRFFTLYAHYNSLFWASPEAALPDDCRPLSDALRRTIGEPALVFPGRASPTCEKVTDDGSIEVTIFTGAGEQNGEEPGTRVPARIYFAAMSTTPEHLAEDLPRFRAVLASIEIAP